MRSLKTADALVSSSKLQQLGLFCQQIATSAPFSVKAQTSGVNSQSEVSLLGEHHQIGAEEEHAKSDRFVCQIHRLLGTGLKPPGVRCGTLWSYPEHLMSWGHQLSCAGDQLSGESQCLPAGKSMRQIKRTRVPCILSFSQLYTSHAACIFSESQHRQHSRVSAENEEEEAQSLSKTGLPSSMSLQSCLILGYLLV